MKLTPNQLGAAERGASVIIAMLCRIGEPDVDDHVFARTIVENEMALRALAAFAQAELAKDFFDREDFVS